MKNNWKNLESDFSDQKREKLKQLLRKYYLSLGIAGLLFITFLIALFFVSGELIILFALLLLAFMCVPFYFMRQFGKVYRQGEENEK